MAWGGILLRRYPAARTGDDHPDHAAPAGQHSLPRGFFAFGTGSILLTALELHRVPAGQAPSVMVLILALVVPLELL